MSNVIKRYTDYKLKNAEIKTRQRIEREAELQPFLADIGREITVERNDGRSVLYISALLGLKNKNFIYDALRAYDRNLPEGQRTTRPKAFAPAPGTATPASPENGSEAAQKAPERLFDWTFRDNSDVAGGMPDYYKVNIVGDPDYHTLTVEPNGDLALPYSWLHESVPARIRMFKQIVAEIESSRAHD